jgi:2-polyprenyl-3-methyl-5-hydroxy-6-metoxy-1,4-benzoquinol methylase
MHKCRDNLCFTIGKRFTIGEHENIEMLSIVQCWSVDTRQQQLEKLDRLIVNIKRIANTSTSKCGCGDDETYKLKEALKLIDSIKPTRIMDIGAGKGELLSALARKFKLQKENAIGVELKLIDDSTRNFTMITYQDNGELPVEDSSVDVIILTHVLHHMHQQVRNSILLKIDRMLTPNGIVVIEEHDYDESTAMYLSLDILHNFWYIVENESIDAMYLMRREQTDQLFFDAGFMVKPDSQRDAKGWQRNYWNVYIRK